MAKVKVVIENKQKTVKIPTGLRMLLRRCCAATLEYENFGEAAEVDITIVDDEMIRQLNREYRHIDRATDVLSFPLGENGVYDKNPETGAYMLGDVVVSIEHAQAQAELYEHSFRREMGFLVVHSMLHLLGYDHEEGGLKAVRMREHEEAIMQQIGLPRDAAYAADE
ncbi:MAG: rRNA maturation RNase YbeY [Clostridia bacterium]|nr:rRNA maturation RNase YbeY [Clostridia bacterium]